MEATLVRRRRPEHMVLRSVGVRGLDRGWPARALAHSRTQIVRLYVLEGGRPGSRSEVGTYVTDGKTAEELLEEIERDADGQANGLSGVVHFFVAAHPGEEEDERILTSTTFAVEGSVVGGASDEEAGTPQSMLAQAHRFIENIMRVSTSRDAVFMEFAQQRLHDQQEEIVQLRADRQRVLEREESLNIQEHKRQLEAKEQEASAKLKQSVVDNISPYASAVVGMFAKHLGITQVRGVASELELAGKGVAQAIKTDDFEKLMVAGLSKEAMLALYTLQETAMRSSLVTPSEKATQDEAIDDLKYKSMNTGAANGTS